MQKQEIPMIDILRLNKGFKDPAQWVEYAIKHKFKRVTAERLETCPDCGGQESALVGQYIYYSTLVELRSCANCGLLYADTRIDPAVIHSHFELAYKDENYFTHQRRRIFDQIAGMVDRAAAPGASVLDIGGAKGHLLALLKQRRPDLKLVLNDLSTAACSFAEAEYGLETVCGGVKTLEGLSRSFDVVIMSDVIYYEPEIQRFWGLLSHLVSNGGVVIIRVPNFVALIKLSGILRRLGMSREARAMQSAVPFFNPEHLYVFSRGYLSRRLQGLGFNRFKATPSALLGNLGRTSYGLYYAFAKMIWLFSWGQMIMTPSMVVVAERQP